MTTFEERKKGEPLLYIHQPKLQDFPEIKMQDYFYSGDVRQITPHRKEIEKEAAKEIGKQEDKLIPPSKKVENADSNNQTNPVSAADYFRKNSVGRSRAADMFKLATPFKQMPVIEKLRYLAAFPEGQPPFGCEFSVAGKKYRGTLSKLEENEITIKTFTEGDVKVLLSDVGDIRIIG